MENDVLFRARETIRNLMIYLFMANRNDLRKDAREDFVPENYRKKHIANSSIITMFQNEEQTLFFRECRRHRRLKDYLREHIEDYFDNVCTVPDREELRAAVLGDLAKKENYKKALRITAIFNDHLIEILSGAYSDHSATGFPCFAGRENNGDFISFLQYFSCVRISHQVNAYVREGKHENFNANKQLATYHLSRLLGLDGMVPAVWPCRFVEDGKEKVGTMMDKADGLPPSSVLPAERRNYVKQTLLRDVTSLEYFDALCYQLDHRPDNYYVTQDESGAYDRVVAFDNDAARTFFVLPTLPTSTYAGASSVLAKDGAVARPYIDKAFAERLLQITRREVKCAVGEYLSAAQLFCLWGRMKRLRRAILKTAAQRPDFLVSDWTSVKEENAAAETWGKTYVNIYLNDTVMLDREKAFAEMRNQP